MIRLVAGSPLFLHFPHKLALHEDNFHDDDDDDHDDGDGDDDDDDDEGDDDYDDNSPLCFSSLPSFPPMKTQWGSLPLLPPHGYFHTLLPKS